MTARADSKVLAERVPATRVYGAPPSVEVVKPERSYRPQFAAPPTPVLPPGPRRQLTVVAAAAVAILVVAAGLWFYAFQRDRPIRAALEAATVAYQGVLHGLLSAEDLDGVRAAGNHAVAASGVIGQTELDLDGHDNDFARAARRVIDAEKAVATATAELAALSDTQLGVWGSAERGLTAARESLVAARRGLSPIDSDRAGQVADPAKAIDHARGVVGRSASRLLTRSAAALIGRLGSITRTADLRTIAADSRDDRAVVRAALSGLSGDSAQEVQAAGRVFEQLARLHRIDREHLLVWSRVRVPLVAALGAVPEAEGNAAVAHVDQLIGDASAAMAQWRTDLARAERKQARARRITGRYEAAVREQLSAYDGLRSELSTFFQSVDAGVPTADPTADPAADRASVLLQALTDRQAVLTGLQGITVPPVFLDVHDGLLQVVGQAVAAVKAAYDALPSDDSCHEACDPSQGDYKDSDSYRAFHDASEQSATAYTQAEAAWGSAIARFREQISDKALPKAPNI